jgi:hypothetical protein
MISASFGVSRSKGMKNLDSRMALDLSLSGFAPQQSGLVLAGLRCLWPKPDPGGPYVLDKQYGFTR